MTWAPSARIVSAATPPAFRMRGLGASALLCWPGSNIGAGADYSVDFGGVLDQGDSIVQAAVSVTGGTLGWGGQPTWAASIASAWIDWTTPGAQQATFTVLTAVGRTHTATVYMAVSDIPALLPPEPSPIPPNTLTLPSGMPLLTPSGNPLLVV